MRERIKRCIDILPGWASCQIFHVLRLITSSDYRTRLRFESAAFARMGKPQLVQAGLFEGMRFPRTFGSQGGYISKVEGVYELPVQAALRELFQKPVSCFIDIGAAEGYYAVGMAKLFPALKVIAFELEKCLQHTMRCLARDNGVSNIEIRGRCGREQLQRLTSSENTVILCDVEGYEDFLLEPESIPKLRSCSIVVELHEEYAPGITERLRRRFSSTHMCRVVQQSDTTDQNANFRGSVPAYVREGRRNSGEWMILLPKCRRA